MSKLSLVTGSNGSLAMTDMASDSNDDPSSLTVPVQVPRSRKLTEILMDDSDPEDAKTEDAEEKTNAPKSNKAQKLKDAIMEGKVNAVASLLDQKIDVNLSDSFGRSALHNAVLKGVPTIVEMLLNANADVNIKDDRQDSPVHYVARTGNPQVLKLLLSKPDCDVNLKGSSLYSPLHIAASLNKPDLCKILLEHHANPNIQEDNGKSPLGRAVESGATQSAKFLLEYMKNLGISSDQILYNADFDGTTLLHLAVDSGFTEVVELCLEHGSRIRHPRRSDRSTAFHLACEQGSSAIVQVLVRHDPSVAKILLVNLEGITPLHQAAKSNSHGIADILIEQGAEVNARNNDNRTPVMLAAKRGATETVKLLLDKGADPKLKDVDNRTVIFDAVGYPTIMALLLENSQLAPTLTEKDLMGFSAAHYAAKRGDAKSMSLFLEHNKATASVVSDSLDTPLHVAAKYGSHEVVRVILEKQGGKVINIQNSRARTALHLACNGGHYRAAILLLEKGANIERDQNGRTALHEAAQKGAKKVVQMVIDKHTYCLNYIDDDKNTALHIAVQHGHAEIIHVLLSLRKQEILINSSNQNILDLAVELGNPTGAMAIVEHDRWSEVLESCTNGVSKMITKLVLKMPHVAEQIFDNCIETEGDKMNEEYRIKFNLNVLLRKSVPEMKSSLEILKVVADNRIENCLTHKLSFIVLSTKWNSYGWLAFVATLFSVLVYLLPLSYIQGTLEDGDVEYCPDRVNTSATGQLIYLLNVNTCLKTHLDMQIGQYIIIVVICFLILKEMFQIYSKGALKYFTTFTNLIELVAFISALVSLIPTCECKWGYQKQAAAIALFFGWINLIMYLQGLPFYGKYVIMLYTMFVTLIKVMLLFCLFALAFGTTFHLIIDQDPFTDLPNIMMNMFIMMLGEINYMDVFVPWTKLFYPFMSNLILVLFCLTMPIILMNMLVGLSVGDIDAIEQSALIDRYVLQIELLNNLEESFPLWLLRRVQKKSFTYYPNKRPSIGTRIFNALIGFGDVESESTFESEEKDLGTTVREMHEKFDEQSHTIDEMKVQIKQMLDMMKQAEAMKEKEKKAKPAPSSRSMLPLESFGSVLPGLPGLPGLSFGLGSKKSADTNE